MKSKPFRPLLHACYRAYIVQAIINNLAPVLFTTFAFRYNIPVEQIASLVLLNFVVQIGADLFSMFFVDKMGMRNAALMAHICAAVGLWAMALLPGLLPPFVGLCLAVSVCGWGGGLLEVLVSPIVDSIPGDAKAATMSLLHAFYCWGQVLVVLVSTLLLALAGGENWFFLPLLWSLLPLLNFFAFRRVEIPGTTVSAADATPADAVAERRSLGSLFKSRLFWLLLLLMVAAGASEHGMAQWASAFAEVGLGVNKTLGDLLGPCLFGVFMAIGRTAHGVLGERIPLKKMLVLSSLLCIGCDLGAALLPWPLLALACCALCGLGVSLFWPGVCSIGAARLKGGTPMFGAFAILGDVGCAAGPWLVGLVAGASGGVGHLSTGLLVGALFPLVMLVGLQFTGRSKSFQ